MQGFLLLFGALSLLAGCTSGAGEKSALMDLQGEAQGTTFTIKYIDSLQRDLSKPIDSLLRTVDRSLSLWDSTSTVTRFNSSRTRVRQLMIALPNCVCALTGTLAPDATGHSILRYCPWCALGA